MDSKQKQEQVGLSKPVNSTEIFKDSLSSAKPRFYDTDSLHELLCSRYGLSRHESKQKLVDLVEKELSI